MNLTVELVGNALAKAIRSGEISDYREGTRFVAELIGTSVPDQDYLKMEELDEFSMLVGAAVAFAHFQLLEGGDGR